MPNFTELLFASLLLILTMTWSGFGATLPFSMTLSSPPPPPERHSLGQKHNSIEPPDKICHLNSDCPSTQCCTVGMMRYSTPICRSYGGVGDSCILENTVQNFTLSYPNGEEVTVIDSFRLLCPCAPDLHCDENTVSCMGA